MHHGFSLEVKPKLSMAEIQLKFKLIVKIFYTVFNIFVGTGTFISVIMAIKSIHTESKSEIFL